MIQATFFNDKENNVIVMKIKGHARQAEPGKDLICSSASILAYTLAQTLKYIEHQGGVKKLRIKLDSGDAFVKCWPTEDYYDVILHTYFVAEVGYSLLSNNYPEYVELKMFGEA